MQPREETVGGSLVQRVWKQSWSFTVEPFWEVDGNGAFPVIETTMQYVYTLVGREQE